MSIRSWGAVVLLLTGLVLSGGKALADPQIPPRGGAVVDLADLLEPFQEQPLAERLSTLKARNGVDFVVVTLPSLQGYSIETWGRRLGNGWNVGGRSGLGALLLIAPNDREVRIEIGDALGVMFPDSAAASIIDNEILPRFREGRLSAGILVGIDAMIYQVTRPLMAVESTTEPNLEVERSTGYDWRWLRSRLPSQAQVLTGLFILFLLFVLHKANASRSATHLADDVPDDFSGRTVYRNEGSSWISSPRHRHDRGSGGFGGFGSVGIFGSSGRSGGFSGSGSSRSFGGSSGRSSGGGFSGRGASGRW